ncbi:MAG: hypothetical protein H0X01_05625 [Nitrospira sp.]|nr:hypothetical protein [Nitrospira sp.]
MARTAEGIQLTLPPVGVLRAGKGSFWSGLCFCAGIAILSVVWVLIAIAGAGEGETRKGVYTPPDPNSPLLPWQMWAFLIGFGLISLAVTLHGLSMAVRSAVIEVAGDALQVWEKGMFRNRTLRWNREELKAIQSGPSGMSVGSTRQAGRTHGKGFSVRQLHVYLNDGRRVRMLTGREDEELDWVAAQLRAALRTGTTKYEGD